MHHCYYNVIMAIKTNTKLTKIGNSRGVRLPKTLIEQAGLKDDLELTTREGQIIIANQHKPREGWAKAYEAAAARGDLVLTPEDQEWLNMPDLPDEQAGWEWD
jgi:antitoxin MazE